jgi:hypothetical protein
VPPRYAYWTILIDNGPTAFRARDKDELLPTLTQLRRTNRHVDLRWFARGRLWDNPEQAQWASQQAAVREKRGKDWRPGGAHKDPRARFDKRAAASGRDRRNGARERTDRQGDRPRGEHRGPATERSRAGAARPQARDNRPPRGGARVQAGRKPSWKDSSRRAGPPHGGKRPAKPAPDRSRGPETVPPDKRQQSPDRPPSPEQIVTRPKPPERG